MIQEIQRIVGLVSGGASTMAEIIRATQDGRLPRSEIVGIISSNPDAIPDERLALFKESQIPLLLVLRKDYKTREAYGEALLNVLKPLQPDVIGQYGHTPLTPENVILEFEGRMINQHPGPVDPGLHDFGGRGMSSADRVHTARLLFVERTQRNFWTDVTAQRVATVFDKGKVLKRGRVAIVKNETTESLKKKSLRTEWAVQIDTLSDFEDDLVEELPPYTDLVLPHEYDILEEVKKEAIRLYP